MKTLIPLSITLSLALAQTPPTTGSAFCTKPSTDGCGSVCSFKCDKFPDVSVPMYVFSFKEMGGTCRRKDMEYKGKRTVLVESDTVEQCECRDAICETCTKDKTAADVKDCCGKQVTFDYYGVKIPLQTDTGKKDTCCTADGVDSEGQASSICYCTGTTTECFTTTKPKLCPPPVQARIIGGTPVDPCTSGLIRFSTDNSVLCNGVYTNNPKGKDSTGASLTRPVVYVPTSCMGAIDLLTSDPNIPSNIMVTVGDKSFKYTTDEVIRITLEKTFYTALVFKTFTSPCLDPACTYNPDTMGSAINKTDCFLLSFGSDSLNSGSPQTSGKLNKLELQFIEGSCPDKVQENAQCFLPKKLTGAYSCTVGDIGAPVFCSLNSGETALYGTFEPTGKCGENIKFFPVVPVN